MALEKDTSSKIWRTRLVARTRADRLKINRKGQSKPRLSDLYIYLLTASWGRLAKYIICIYLILNVLFACVYILLGDGIDGARHGSFVDAFFFSVQTISTLGYGVMTPVGLAANIISTIEVLGGFVFFAMITGMIYSRFSRPVARVLFSNVAVISPYNGKPHLMIRLANQRNNRIVDANVHAVVLIQETSMEGRSMRHFIDLHLLRTRVPLLQLSWTLLHPIDESSSLYGLTAENIHNWDGEIIISLTGLDETFGQTVHARFSYIADDIIPDAFYADVITRSDEDRSVEINYDLFHEIVPLIKKA